MEAKAKSAKKKGSLATKLASPKIKVQLDNKTTITVNSEKALERWLERFPQAKILAN